MLTHHDDHRLSDLVFSQIVIGRIHGVLKSHNGIHRHGVVFEGCIAGGFLVWRSEPRHEQICDRSKLDQRCSNLHGRRKQQQAFNIIRMLFGIIQS